MKMLRDDDRRKRHLDAPQGQDGPEYMAVLERLAGAAADEMAASVAKAGLLPVASMSPAAWLTAQQYDRREPGNYDRLIAWMESRAGGGIYRGLLVCGLTGTGKSSGLRAAAVYSEACRIVTESDWHVVRRENEAEAMNYGGLAWVSRYRMPLLIDDLGTDRNSGYVREANDGAISNLIDARYRLWQRERVITHITANLFLSAEAATAANKAPATYSIEARYGSRTYSRLLEMCYPVVFEGEDQRQQAKRIDDDFTRRVKAIGRQTKQES